MQHNVTAISTKEDLSDLEQQVLPFLKDLPRAQTAATRAQGLFRHYSRPEVLAKDWDELLLRVSERSGDGPMQDRGGRGGARLAPAGTRLRASPRCGRIPPTA